MKTVKKYLLIMVGGLMFVSFENKSIAGRRSKIDSDAQEASTQRSQKSAPKQATKVEVEKAGKKGPPKMISTRTYATLNDIILKKRKGSPGRGGGPKGFYWSIIAWGTSAGKVFINWIDEPPLGPHASLQIFLNKKSQGKHVGRIVYAQASTLSSYNEVYVHIAKSNPASIKSALAAGFKEVKDPKVRQALLKWTRPK